MTTTKSTKQYKNDFLKSTYDRKCQISYDRLLLVLNKNINKLRSVPNIINFIIGIIVSVASFFITLITANFSKGDIWIQHIFLLVCGIVVLYYIGYIVFLCIYSKSTEDIIYELEQNNELDKSNRKKKRGC